MAENWVNATRNWERSRYFLSLSPCVAWTGWDLFVSFEQINCESAENKRSVLFYFLSRKGALLASDLPRIWSEKTLSEWRAEIVGLQFYQGCNHQEYQQEIHFAFPWALESKPHHLTLMVICGFTKNKFHLWEIDVAKIYALFIRFY